MHLVETKNGSFVFISGHSLRGIAHHAFPVFTCVLR